MSLSQERLHSESTSEENFCVSSNIPDGMASATATIVVYNSVMHELLCEGTGQED